MKAKTGQTKKASTGPIQRDTVYPLDSFQALSGLGDFATRMARRSGLRVIKAGKNVFVRGEDFIDWLNKQAEPSAAASSN
jgi:hypothetical protein